VTPLLLDTDIVSFQFKNHSYASLYDLDLLGHPLVISFMALAELERWALSANWGQARRDRLKDYIAPYTILASSDALSAKWAEVTVTAQRNGFRIECADAWIAATALLCNLPLVTHNRQDYRGVPGLQIVSHAA
jgi:predicted nucleic acid-binding protein